MSIKLGNNDITFKVGSVDVDAIYLGSTKLYPKEYKFVGHYSDGSEYKIECDSSTALTQAMISGSGKDITTLRSAEINSCGHSTFKVDDNAFSGATNLSSITMDNGVTQLGNQSFMYCSGLTSFTFPSNLQRIDGACFRYANSITSLNVPSGLTYLGSGCFADMAGLTTATLPNTLTGTSTNLFLRDSSLNNVHFLGTTAPALGVDAFKQSGIQKIYIPTCDSYDSYAATAGMSAYTNIIYAEDETSCYKPIRDFKLKRYFINNVNDEIACDSSSALTTNDIRTGKTMSVLTSSTSGLCAVEVGDCISSIGNSSFQGLNKLSAVTISDNVETIGMSAFCISNTASDNRIHDIDLGNGVKTISKSAFIYAGYAYGSNYITEIKIPKSVTYIGSYAFSSSKMKKLTLNTTSSTTIDDNAFRGATGNSITIDATIGVLNGYAFYTFYGLTQVKISGLTSLHSDGHQFGVCGQLQSIEIYGTNLTIPQYFVNGDSLTSVTLSGISYINNAYGLNSGNSSSSTRILKMLDTTPPPIGGTSISNYNPTVIYVPSSAVNAYKSANNWSTYASRIQAIPT